MLKAYGVIGVALVLASFGIAAQADSAEPPATVDKLEGTWVIVSCVNDGGALRAKEFKGMKVVIGRNVLILAHEDGTVQNEYALTFNGRASPQAITFRRENAPKGKESAFGIIKLEGNVLHLCVSEEGWARPTQFLSPKGSHLQLIKLRKLK